MSFILQLSFIFSAKLPNLLSSNCSAINLLFWNRMTVQFIFGHGVVKIECTAFISCEGPSFFLSSKGVTPSGNPAIKVKRVLYEGACSADFCISLKQVSFKCFSTVCLTSPPQCPGFLCLHPLPPGCLTFLPKSLSPPSSVRTGKLFPILTPKLAVTFPPLRVYFSLSRAACLSIAVSAICISYTSLAYSCSLWMSQIVSWVLPVCPKLLQPSPALCPFLWQAPLTSFYLFHQI